MNDNDYKRVKDFIPPIYYLWSERLRLQDWSISFNGFRDGIPDDRKNPGSDAIMVICCLWQYKSATIDLDAPKILEFLNDLDEDAIQKSILHELLHAVVHEMRPDQCGAFTESMDDDIPLHQIKHEERVVEHLTEVIWQAYNGVPTVSVVDASLISDKESECGSYDHDHQSTSHALDAVDPSTPQPPGEEERGTRAF